ncbi:bacterial regulatory helix-turn-helix, lysR family protein [Mycobacterium avium subsp. avium 2285 (R)]|nr:bacterial regulatory helix-turn-helix, lysR family protein [Mycobacterium avium subsp. avium 2285 (R)]
MKELEAELGVQLFVRSYHRVELTEAGQALAGRVRGILEEVDALKPALQRFREGQRRIRIGASHLAPPRDVDRFLSVVREAGDLETLVEFAASEPLLAALKRTALDVALVHLPVDEPDLHTVVVARHSFKLVMRADDPLAGSTGVHLAEVADRSFTLPTAAMQPMVITRMHHIVRAAGITALRHTPSPDTFMVAADIRQNGTIALTTDPELGGPSQIYADPAYAVVDLLDDLYFDIGAVCKQTVVEQDSAICRIMQRLREISPAADRSGDEVSGRTSRRRR